MPQGSVDILPFLDQTPGSRQITGAIFAGGKSLRMGQPKAALPLWDHRPMMDHVMAQLAPLCHQLVVVGTCSGYDVKPQPGLYHIQDIHPGYGPMAGMEALLSSGFDTEYLVMTCDQPLVTTDLLEQLLVPRPQLAQATDPSNPRTNKADRGFRFFCMENGHPLLPFPGVYPAGWLPQVKQAMAEHRYSLRDTLEAECLQWIPLPPETAACLESINTPAQWQHLMTACLPMDRDADRRKDLV